MGAQSCPRGCSSSEHQTSLCPGFLTQPRQVVLQPAPGCRTSPVCGPRCPTMSPNVPEGPTQVPQGPTMPPRHPRQLQPMLSPRTKPGQTKPMLLWPSLELTPHSPGTTAPMPGGFWWGSGGMDGCEHSCRAMGSEPELSCSADGWLEWVAGRRKHFLTSQPPDIRANVRGGANPVRLCRKWQSPGRHPPGEDTRGYAPHTCHGAQLGKGHRGDTAWKGGTANSLHSSKSQQRLLLLIPRGRSFQESPSAPERCQTPAHICPLLSSRRKITIQAVTSLKIEFY